MLLIEWLADKRTPPPPSRSAWVIRFGRARMALVAETLDGLIERSGALSIAERLADRPSSVTTFTADAARADIEAHAGCVNGYMLAVELGRPRPLFYYRPSRPLHEQPIGNLHIGLGSVAFGPRSLSGILAQAARARALLVAALCGK